MLIYISLLEVVYSAVAAMNQMCWQNGQPRRVNWKLRIKAAAVDKGNRCIEMGKRAYYLAWPNAEPSDNLEKFKEM